MTGAQIDEEEAVKRTWGLVAVGLSGACVVAACGGSSAGAPASSTPANTGAGAPGQAYPTDVPQGTPPVSPSSTDEATRPQNGAVQSRPPAQVDTSRVSAREELNRAEAQLFTAQKDCVSACRALASMERAAKSLCDLGGADECSQARARVEAARDRVRSSCGACPSTR